MAVSKLMLWNRAHATADSHSNHFRRERERERERERALYYEQIHTKNKFETHMR